MSIRHRLDFSTDICRHIHKDEIGSPNMEIGLLEANGMTCEVIHPGSGNQLHGFINLTGRGKIEIITPFGERDGLILMVRTKKIETRIYLPQGVSLSALDSAVCSAIMANRAWNEQR